jgi:hypothetical protein
MTDRRPTMMTHKRWATSLVAMMCLAVPSSLSAHGLHAAAVTNVLHTALHALELAAVVVAGAWVGWALSSRARSR